MVVTAETGIRIRPMPSQDKLRRIIYLYLACVFPFAVLDAKKTDIKSAKTISAHKLWQDLQKDEAQFKKKYFLKTVQVTGLVKKRVVEAGISQIWLGDQSDDTGLICCQLYPGTEIKATVGEKLSLEGMVGAPLFGFVRMQMCKSIPVGTAD